MWLLSTQCERFIANCQAIYIPHEYITIDEHLAIFLGGCNFRHCIPQKTSKMS